MRVPDGRSNRCRAGAPGTASEDSTATGPGIVVLLDGATARTETGCIHGVAWFADSLARGINEHAHLGPTEALAAAISQTADSHRDTCDLSHPGTPSAAVAIVQITEGAMRYLVLGDVTIAVDTTAGLQVISDQRVSQTALAERAAADAMHAGDPEKTAALVRMKHAELAARNVEGGYWVATTNPVAARHALTGEVPLSRVRQVAVLSDGAVRAVDAFGLDDWSGAFEVLCESGPAELVRQVRAAESSDPKASRWPRNKISDDATIAYCTSF